MSERIVDIGPRLRARALKGGEAAHMRGEAFRLALLTMSDIEVGVSVEPGDSHVSVVLLDGSNLGAAMSEDDARALGLALIECAGALRGRRLDDEGAS